MAGYGVKRNYRKTSTSNNNENPMRPSRLNLNGGVAGKYTISPPSSPVKLQSPDVTNHKFVSPDLTNHRPRSTNPSLSRNNSRNSCVNSAKTSMMQSNNSINNNNNNRSKSSSLSQTPSRLVATPPGSTAHASSQHRTRTPSVERSLSSIKETPDAAKVRGRSFWGGWWKF